MVIGNLGSINFEVSPDKLLTFDELKRKRQMKTAEHEIHLQKPKLEYVGQVLDEISFSIQINATLNLHPQESLDEIVNLYEEHEPVTFAVAGKSMSKNKWFITLLDEDYLHLDGSGALLAANISLSIKEYVEGVDTSRKSTEDATQDDSVKDEWTW